MRSAVRQPCRARPCVFASGNCHQARRSLCVSCAAPALAAATDALLSWAVAKKVTLDKVLLADDMATGQRILVASKDIAAGETVLTVPDALWITPHVVQSSAIGQYVSGLELWLQVALFLLHSRHSQGSPWKAYLDTFADPLDTPLFWPEQELALLEGTQALQSVQSYRSFFKSRHAVLFEELFSRHPNVFPPDVFTADALTWAIASVRARVHAPLEKDDVALVPLADLVQHQRGGPLSWQVKGGGLWGARGLVLVASAPVRTGAALAMDFGPEAGDNSLLVDYGVVDAEAGQGGFLLSLDMEGDKFSYDKLDVLEQGGLRSSGSWLLRADQDIPEDMMAFLRLRQLSGGDAFLLESVFRGSCWGHMQLPVSRDNEECVCRAMADGAAAVLRGYAGSIEGDLAALRDAAAAPPGSRTRKALLVRLGEQEALDAVQRFFSDRLGELDRLEYYAERRLKRLGLMDDDGGTTYSSFFKDGIA